MMGELEHPPRRLSISEETLRLQLAELELRLRIFFAEQLEKKASADEVRDGIKRITALESGDLTPAMRRSVIELVSDEGTKSDSASWTRRERFVMVVGLSVTLLMLLLSAYVVYHTASPEITNIPKVSNE